MAPRKQDKSSGADTDSAVETVQVLCRHSVLHDGKHYHPETVAELPIEEADRLEEGGYVERVFGSEPVAKEEGGKPGADGDSAPEGGKPAPFELLP